MESYCSQTVTKLAKALIAVQKEMAPAMKDANNPFTKSKYATLNSVMESCREALLVNGIWLTQLPVPAPAELGPGHIGLLTKLTHAESGEWQSSLTVAPLPKNDPQGMGSALTYCRRYALTAMLGMVTEDDDGESAKMPARPAPRSRRPAPQTQNGSFDEAAQGNYGFPPENLPRLEGVFYEAVTTQDGRNCIIATGNTHPRKEILSGAGFRWDAQRKCWWKYADVA